VAARSVADESLRRIGRTSQVSEGGRFEISAAAIGFTRLKMLAHARSLLKPGCWRCRMRRNPCCRSTTCGSYDRQAPVLKGIHRRSRRAIYRTTTQRPGEDHALHSTACPPDCGRACRPDLRQFSTGDRQRAMPSRTPTTRSSAPPPPGDRFGLHNLQLDEVRSAGGRGWHWRLPPSPLPAAGDAQPAAPQDQRGVCPGDAAG
jgi:hypothetical protein